MAGTGCSVWASFSFTLVGMFLSSRWKNTMNHKPASFRIHPTAHAARALVMLAGLAGPGLALAQLEFSKSPPRNIAGSVSTSTSVSGGVLPNVIVAVDGTGSMSAADAACQTGSVKDAFGTNYPLTCPAKGIKSRMEALSDALLMAFSDPALVGKIRLAFQATSLDAGFGPNRFNRSSHDNSMKVFTKEYQADFMNWAFLLKSRIINCNPTEPMIAYAGEYLKGQWIASGASNYVCENGGNLLPGTNSPDPKYYLKFTSIPASDNPWNSNAKLRTKLAAKDASDAIAETNSDRLSCRRSYLIFMTDGGVNGNQFAPVGTSNNNYGNSTHTFPDGTAYDPAKYYGKIYSDFSPNNYADHTLYYWGTDLTGKGKGVIAPMMPVASDETFSSTYNGTAYTQTYEPYWNPKNNPATWQHMQTYTVGFGANGGAGNLPSGKYAHPSGSSAKINLPIGFDGYDAAGNVLNYGNFFQMFATGAPMSGAISWPYVPDCDGCSTFSTGQDVTLDVYHAALAGRGKYYPATSVSALSAAFKDILNNAMIPQGVKGRTGSAAGSSAYTNGNAMGYMVSYVYEADAGGGIGGWSGSLDSYVGTGASSDGALASAPKWSAKIPADTSADPRKIFTASPSGAGIPFTEAGLDKDPSEIASATVKTVRALPLGDIVNSQLAYVSKPTLSSQSASYAKFAKAVNAFNGGYRQSVIYVGANDGMLHGFDAGNGTPAAPGTGKELWAYVPRGLLGQLSAFDGTYVHRYWVDGGMFGGDAQLDTGSYGMGTGSSTYDAGAPGHWATVLVGTLGAGGPGYFVLDVTKPDAIMDTDNLKNAVLIDATDLGPGGPLAKQTVPGGQTPEAAPPGDTPEAETTPGEPPEAGTPVPGYIGHQFSPPVMDMYNRTGQPEQIVRINTRQKEGEWAVIMGNGYNSKSGLPVLLIQSLSQKTEDGALSLYTVAATCTLPSPADCVAAGNGLSAPRPVDVDGNGTADFVYAGDLLGNLWKFDISSVDRKDWKVAYGEKPMFTAVGPGGKAQPITSAPVAVPHPRGGLMVGFGTGRNLTAGDPSDKEPNSFYALYDQQKISAGLVTIVDGKPPVKAARIGLQESEADPAAFCAAGSGQAARYTTCLYQRGQGALGAPSDGLSTGQTSAPADGEKIDGDPMRGWYYDIPGDTGDAAAAKVLANPMMVGEGVALFYSDNVASSTSLSVQGNGSESCGSSTIASSPVRTLNYFDLFTGAPPPGNLIVTAGGATYTFGGGQKNRFRISGVGQFIRSGPNRVVGNGGSGAYIEPLGTTLRGGWRIIR